MKQAMRMGAAVALIAVGARAEDRYEIKVYPASRAVGPVVVDGELAEASWQASPVVSGFTHYDRPERANPQTHVRITYDEDNLYFGVLCDEPRINLVMPVPAARDSREVFRGEAIEIFIDPGHSHSEYYQFGISSAGSIYDSRVTDRVWNASVQAGARHGEASWSVEVAIPWSDLGQAPSPGTVIGFNVCRDRQVGNRQWTNWAQTKANFHDPVRFAHLVLSPPEEDLAPLREEFRKGERRGPIAVYSPEGALGSPYRDLAAAALSAIRRSLSELEVAAIAEPSGVARQELTSTIEAYESRIRPFEEKVARPEALDASTWSRMELTVDEMASEMSQALWEARLRALLGRI